MQLQPLPEGGTVLVSQGIKGVASACQEGQQACCCCEGYTEEWLLLRVTHTITTTTADTTTPGPLESPQAQKPQVPTC